MHAPLPRGCGLLVRTWRCPQLRLTRLRLFGLGHNGVSLCLCLGIADHLCTHSLDAEAAVGVRRQFYILAHSKASCLNDGPPAQGEGDPYMVPFTPDRLDFESLLHSPYSNSDRQFVRIIRYQAKRPRIGPREMQHRVGTGHCG